MLLISSLEALDALFLMLVSFYSKYLLLLALLLDLSLAFYTLASPHALL